MALKDYYDTGYTTNVTVYGNYYHSQEFTAGSNYTITSVALYLSETGTPPANLTVEIRNTNQSGIPTNPDSALVSGTILETDVSTSPTYGWIICSLGVGTALTSGTKYAVVIYTSGGSTSNCYRWSQDGTTPFYTGGKSGSAVSDASWGAYDQSYMFKTYDNVQVYDEGILVVAGAGFVVLSTETFPFYVDEGVKVVTIIGSVSLISEIFSTSRWPINRALDYDPTDDFGDTRGGGRYKNNLIFVGVDENGKGKISWV